MAYEHKRKLCCPKLKMLECSEFIDYIIRMVRDNKHSLDAIVGAARLHKLFDETEMVCTKTLYNYVDQGLLSILNIDLPLMVKRSAKSTRNHQNKKVLGTSISERPEQANTEVNSAIGKSLLSSARRPRVNPYY